MIDKSIKQDFIVLLEKMHNSNVNIKYFVNNMQLFDKINVTKSKKDATSIGAMKKSCYYNIAKYMIYEGCKYYEGYVYDKKLNMIFKHAWTVENNRVIDVTVILADNFDENNFIWFGLEIDTGFIRNKLINDYTPKSRISEYIATKTNIETPNFIEYQYMI